MKARGRLVFLACAAAAVLAQSGEAIAKPGFKVRPPGTELFLELGERGGYEVLVEAAGRQHVVLVVSEGLFSSTEYSTKGQVSSEHVKADFGALGQIDIDLRLQPGRSWSYPPGKRCEGPATIEVPGTFHGTIEFSGEGDIPPFSVKRGGVSFTRRFKRVCRAQDSLEQAGKKTRKPQLEVGLLQAFGRAGNRTSFLGAINYASKGKPGRSFGFLVAGAYRRSEGVLIESSTLTFFGHDSFRVSRRGRKPETVKIMKLAEPFAGRALYRRKPGSPPTFTGNLIVDLPGANAIHLANFESDLEVRFCRGSSEAEAEERCAYGSGSHSQPLALARLSSLR